MSRTGDRQGAVDQDRGADGVDLGIAGLWDWNSALNTHRMTMSTVNADDHEPMRNYHNPGDEKQIVVIRPRGLYSDWLDAPAGNSMELMRQFPADPLVATPKLRQPESKERRKLSERG